MSDATAPVLLDLTLPSKIDVSSGSANLFLGLHAQDEPGGSGLYVATVEFRERLRGGQAGDTAFIDAITFGGTWGYDFRDDTPNHASANLSISDLTQSGAYEIARVVIGDRAGNRSSYDTAQLQALGVDTAFTVTGGLVDTVAPTLDSLTLPTSIDLSAGFYQHIRVDGSAHDSGGAGASAISITFDKPLLTTDGQASQELRARAIWRKKDSSPVELDTGLSLSGKAVPGVYNITKVQVSDYLNNVLDYSAAQLQAMGIETAITVIGNPLADSAPAPAKAAMSWTTDEQGVVLTVTPDHWGSASLNSFGLLIGRVIHGGRLGSVTLTGGATGELTVTQDDSSEIRIIGKNIAGGGPGSGIEVEILPDSPKSLIDLSGGLFTINGREAGWGDPFQYFNGSDAADYLDLRPLAVVDGKGGFDTLRVHGGRSEYRIVKDGDAFVLQYEQPSLGVPDMRLHNIERIAFNDDAHVALDAAGRADQLKRLYQAAFDRTPDQTGIGHWLGRMEAGDSLEQIAGYFVASKEFADLYGAAASDRDFVTALYDNVLDRQPDAVGLDFWSGNLGRRDLTRAEVLVEFSESAENIAQVVGVSGQGMDPFP